jgi:uncharacterized protein YidB (DUF937 family)
MLPSRAPIPPSATIRASTRRSDCGILHRARGRHAPVTDHHHFGEHFMGLLDDLLRNMAGQGAAPPAQQAGGSGMSKTLLALLPVVLMMLSRGGQSAPRQAGPQGGGLGDLLGQVLGQGQGGPAMRAGPSGGGLDDLLGQILGGAGGGAAAGGLGGLLEQMRRAGFGDQADSWVQRGPNLPIAPDALEQIFGRQGMSEIARHAGLSEDEARTGLSELLPEVVDRVTPEGRMPDLDALSSGVDELAKQYGFRFR